MRGHLVVICLLVTTFALSVKSKPHASLRSSHMAKHKDVFQEDADAQQLLPTFVLLDTGSGEQEKQELRANAKKVLQATQRGQKSTAVLLSEEELVDLLNQDTDGDLEEEQKEEEEVKEEVDGQEGKDDWDTEYSEDDKDFQAGEEPKSIKLIPTIRNDEQDFQIGALERGQDKLLGEQSQEKEENEEDGDRYEPKPVEDQLLETLKSLWEAGEEQPEVKEDEAERDETNNDTGSFQKVKKRTLKLQSLRKNALHGEDADPEQTAGSTAPKAKQRLTGKWAPLVGMNQVQLRATVDRYPSTKPSLRGNTCRLDVDAKPACVCQEPSQCPVIINDFDHVCGTDNKTYGTACELFATKCNLEGTKRGHRLHLDYTGPCKYWLKNVLLQLYDQDSKSPGLFTAKQHIKVKKIHEKERRLHAGEHPLNLLAQDFEKNYDVYIFPVHWQFAQIDKHPSDRLLSHSELAPLRVPLVPMEHCTSRFFQECDGDGDKQISFQEWAHCFGIKDEDLDVNLLF
ncbi:hypothetical protein NHX12_018448 [Muraenolepis orangiensis]|uniref:SPARC n=1 Tax=Muraenolepis orangiensis TaxID=630683 RepID=A0A9Q0IYI3_9TELE|nr:hypothetical protein NHX12_018448 [Muraenolepis orangiensis]